MIDRFICRREGHVPTVFLYQSKGLRVSAYFTTCQRCGKWFEASAQADPSQRPGVISGSGR